MRRMHLYGDVNPSKMTESLSQIGDFRIFFFFKELMFYFFVSFF